MRVWTRAWRRACGAALISSAWSAFVGASPAELEFSAPKSCPSHEWFTSELAQQGVPEPHVGALRVRVQRAANREGYVASAQTHDTSSSSQSWQRELEGDDCQQLLSALAVSFALHLEGEAADGASSDSAAATGGAADRDSASAPTSAPDPDAQPKQPAAQSGDDPLQDRAISSMRRKLEPALERQWRWGFGLGGAMRTGVEPRVSVAPTLAMVVRARESGWGSGPFSLGVVFAPRSDTDMTGATDGESSWRHGWWAVGLTVTPGTFTLIERVRIGPALAFHAGRYSASLPDDSSRSSAVMFSDLRLHADRQFGDWLVDGHVGLHLPVQSLLITTADQVLHRQEPGLVVGLAASWMGMIL